MFDGEVKLLDPRRVFGRDDEGEVYIVDQDGEVYKIVPAS